MRPINYLFLNSILDNLKFFIVLNSLFFMDPLREAFNKVKFEIDNLYKEKISLELSLAELKDDLKEIKEMLQLLGKKEDFRENSFPAQEFEKKTDTTHNTTDNFPLKPLKYQNLGISTGNQGVPADRQTDRQTDQQTQKSTTNLENPIDNAAEILESLDNIKREIRLKFKRLTEKEWLVFSTIYQLEEEQGFSDHKSLSQRLGLTESSIRDYIGRLIKKGIPVEKERINNKSIRINISENLKKIATLPTILQLREL